MHGHSPNGVYNTGFIMDETPIPTQNDDGQIDYRLPNTQDDVPTNLGPLKQGMKTELDRPVLQQKHFKEFYQRQANPPAEHIIKKLGQYYKTKCRCSTSQAWKLIQRKIPVLYWIPRYDLKSDLIADLLGGLTVGIMQIPQGMGYALLADMPPVMGLYVSFFAVLVYFFFGTSKHLSQGTFSVISLMTANIVNNYIASRGPAPVTTLAPQLFTSPMTTTMSSINLTTTFEPIATILSPKIELDTEKVHLAVAIAFMVGLMQIALSWLQVGFLSVYLSENLVSGFTTGAAVHVFTSQIKYFLGIKVKNSRGFLGIIYIYKEIFHNIHETNLITLGISLSVITVLIIVTDCINTKYKDRLIMPIPIELIVVVITTVVSYYLELYKNYHVQIVEYIPNGLPPPTLPHFDQMKDVVAGAFSVSVVSFCISVSLAIIFAKRGSYDIDPNQELFAYGICNLFSSFFCCFPCCASLSRSTVQVNSGSKTQLCSLVATLLVMIALLFMGPCFEPIPVSVLSGIIMVALRKLFYQVSDCIAAWKVSKMDASIWFVTFWAVVLCDVDYGLLISIGFLLVVFLFRAQRPYITVLGNVPNTETYLDIQKYKTPKEVRGLKIIHFGGALYFANVEYFRKKVYKLVFNPLKVLASLKKKEKAAKKLEDKSTAKGDGVQNCLNGQQQAPSNSSNGFRTTTVTPYTTTPTAAKPSMSTVYEENDFIADIFETRDIDNYLELPPSPIPGSIIAIIIDCSAVSFVDTPALSMINQLFNEYEKINVQLCLAGCRDKVMGKLEKSIFYSKLEKNIFPTIHDAVLQTVNINGVPHRLNIQDTTTAL